MCATLEKTTSRSSPKNTKKHMLYQRSCWKTDAIVNRSLRPRESNLAYAISLRQIMRTRSLTHLKIYTDWRNCRESRCSVSWAKDMVLELKATGKLLLLSAL